MSNETKEKMLALVGFSTIRHSMKTEVLSGITTFCTMSYILALMPALYAPLAVKGYPVDAVFTCTALGAIFGTLLMAFIAKRPFGQAPGLTLNLFFIQTICIALDYPWQFALTAVLIEGLLFVLLCMGNMRRIIIDMVPSSLKHAIAVGIGFFIAMIGFKNSGILAEGTFFNHLDTMMTPSAMLFFAGLLLTGLLVILNVRGGLLISIVVTTVIGIPLGVTKMPDNLFAMPTSPEPLFCQFSWEYLLMPDLWVCVVTMLFFDVFDSVGTVVGVMANYGFIRKDGRIPYMQQIMMSDALGTVGGACLGCSTVTTYVESATGVAEGGRTGMSALVITLCFTASLFLAPLFLAIPTAATAPVMIIAGFYLFKAVNQITLTKPAETVPAFLTILLMTVTGSISDGIIFGLLTYIVLSLFDNWRKPASSDDGQTETDTGNNLAES